jgi:hypothetical protein
LNEEDMKMLSDLISRKIKSGVIGEKKWVLIEEIL